jgi:3-oxoadipate enol-lactonase
MQDVCQIAKIAPQWAAREPNCQYEIIPNARHFAILDDPAFFNRLLVDFLAKWAPVTVR